MPLALLYLGADHRGYQLKEKIKGYLAEAGIEHEDCGAFEYGKDDDYPDFGLAVGRKITADRKAGHQSRGIIVCGSGIGIAVAANKLTSIHAGTAASPEQVKAAVHDEDLNVLALAADFLEPDLALEIVQAFLNAEFVPEARYRRRLDKMEAIEHSRT